MSLPDIHNPPPQAQRPARLPAEQTAVDATFAEVCAALGAPEELTAPAMFQRQTPPRHMQEAPEAPPASPDP
eukprot:CAMPEP_0184099754 /NCGR_PEP_ID=MMETSP0974-20121125/11985_1 /TAXON_ID=483370 /ORGANISM="non described non described, Strain CCMP2097" /LENGTH=71 /DNA_ID=CAMNT_0026402671 /DNA_START=116 /DNA_END=331 /DNA_ORIENTATION=-